MLLGCVLEQAFKDEYSVSLLRAPEVPGVYKPSVTFH